MMPAPKTSHMFAERMEYAGYPFVLTMSEEITNKQLYAKIWEQAKKFVKVHFIHLFVGSFVFLTSSLVLCLMRRVCLP